jgi:L-threonylcarbamoyladenylate synthase
MITKSIGEAALALRSNQLVAVPTETVYGLAAPIDNVQSLQRVFQIKERPFFDPLIVHVCSIEMAKSLVTDWPPMAQTLAEIFWPGPLSLVLPKNPLKVPDLVTSGLTDVAIRWPKHSLTEGLIATVGPLAAPSANKFGKTSPTLPRHVESEFGTELLILDGGACDLGIESTVVQVEPSLALKILRPGGVTIEDLEAALHSSGYKDVRVSPQESAAAPGHLKHHYMPKSPLLLVDGPLDEQELLTLGFKLQDLKQVNLPDDPRLAARELYGRMRDLDQSAKALFIQRQPHQRGGLWTAIWNRVEKAASYNLGPSC